MEIIKKKRVPKVSPEQLEYLVSYMEQNPVFCEARLTQDFNKEERSKQWSCLAMTLNSMGTAIKDVSQWMKTWNDQKTYVKRKAARIKTGSGTGIQDKLSPIEERILCLVGKFVALGDTTQPEAGVPSNNETDKTIPIEEDLDEIIVNMQIDVESSSASYATDPPYIESTSMQNPTLTSKGHSQAPTKGNKSKKIAVLASRVENVVKEIHNQSQDLKRIASNTEKMCSYMKDTSVALASIANSLKVISVALNKK